MGHIAHFPGNVASPWQPQQEGLRKTCMRLRSSHCKEMENHWRFPPSCHGVEIPESHRLPHHSSHSPRIGCC